MSQRFPRNVRLRKRAEYLAVQASGRKVHGRHFLAVLAPAMGERGRLGITVSSKVGIAVTRNRIKRWVREYARRTSFVPERQDVVVIAKRSAADLDGFAEAAADLARMQPRLAS